MARKSIIAAAALASLALVVVPATASAKKDNGSIIKIDVKPRIKKDLGLHVGCRRERKMNEMGVWFTRNTSCVLW
jgi:hypothetical protein